MLPPFWGTQDGLGGLLRNLWGSGGLSRVCSENLQASFLVPPSCPVLQGLGGMGQRGWLITDLRLLLLASGWCFSFSSCVGLCSLHGSSKRKNNFAGAGYEGGPCFVPLGQPQPGTGL